MPHVDWRRLPRHLREHLHERLRTREITEDDLVKLMNWISTRSIARHTSYKKSAVLRRENLISQVLNPCMTTGPSFFTPQTGNRLPRMPLLSIRSRRIAWIRLRRGFVLSAFIGVHRRPILLFDPRFEGTVTSRPSPSPIARAAIGVRRNDLDCDPASSRSPVFGSRS
jgi:hypothetical protein